MIGLVRAAALCATLALGLHSALAADKAFRRDDLADAAIKLEAQIKSEAGAVSKSPAALRNDADAAFKRNDFRGGLQVLGQPWQRTRGSALLGFVGRDAEHIADQLTCTSDVSEARGG